MAEEKIIEKIINRRKVLEKESRCVSYYCINCENPIDNINFKFCPHCGIKREEIKE